jgi:hypothetical protein
MADPSPDRPLDGPGNPTWKAVLWGFIPLLLLSSLVSILVSRHADFIVASSVVTAALAGVSWAWKLPGESWPKQVAVVIAQLLSRRGVAIGLWAAIGLAAVASFFVSSLHVTAATAPDRPVWLYRVVESERAPGLAVKVDSVELDHLHLHRDFYIVPSSTRRVWLMTSDYQRTAAMTFHPWTSLTLGYKDQFRPDVAVAILPWESFLRYVRKDRPLRIRVEDMASGDTVASDSLVDSRAMPSLILAFSGASRVPDTVTTRWTRLALPDAGDSAAAAGVARNWSTPHWLRPRRDLKIGDRLRILLMKANGDIVALDSLTIGENFTDALLKRRS